MIDWMDFAFGLAIGVIVGSAVEAWAWRSSAKDFATLKSAGKRFVVREWHLLR